MKKSLIFSILASIGVAGTAYAAAKATPKALEEIKKQKCETKVDKFKVGWRYYIPSFALGAGTIICIFTAHGINRKEQNELIAAYAMLKKSYDNYRESSKEVFGEDAEEKIFTNIATIQDSFDNFVKANAPDIHISGLCDSSTDFSVDEESRIFFDVMSERYFESTIGKVLQAQYHINRNFTMGIPCSKNDYYEFLGIPKIPGGDKQGWSLNDNLYWIDFDNYRGTLQNGISCLIIEPVFWPDEDFLEYYE